jgi:hypothetical protein
LPPIDFHGRLEGCLRRFWELESHDCPPVKETNPIPDPDPNEDVPYEQEIAQ